MSLYNSESLSTIISNYKSKYRAKQRSKKRQRRILQELADLLNNHALATRGSSLNLLTKYFGYIILDPRHPEMYPGEYGYYLPSGKFIYLTHRPLYVGKGHGKVRRPKSHLKEARNPTSKSRKSHTIRKIWAAGLEPIIQLTREPMTEAEAFAWEIDRIAGFGRKDLKEGYLANLTDGGEGASGAIRSEDYKLQVSKRNTGYRHTEDAKQRMRLSSRKVRPPLSQSTKDKIATKAKGRTVSDETRSKMSARRKGVSRTGKAAKGHKQSPEHVAKAAIGRLGRKHSRKTRNRMGAIQRKEIMAEGVLYSSRQEAAIALSLSGSLISHRVRSKNYPEYYYTGRCERRNKI